MGGIENTPTDPGLDLQREMEKRKDWYFECQLRSLNLDSLRGISVETPTALLNLDSEPLFTMGFPAGQIGGRLQKIGQVYLDDQEPVWTPDERSRRDALASTMIGKMGNWLDFKAPQRLAGALADLKNKFERSKFSSVLDLDRALNTFARTDPSKDGLGIALSRGAVAASKPWLIPELYNAKNPDTTVPENWVANLEKFIVDFENESQLAVGGISGESLPFDTSNTKGYRAWVEFILGSSSTRSTEDSVKVSFLDKIPDKTDKSKFTYQYNISIGTSGYPMGAVTEFPFSDSVKYWTRIFESPAIKEVYSNKANSDMGLCLLMRVLYLHGTLPASMGEDSELTWRKRSPPDDNFTAFFAKKADDPLIKNNSALMQRFQTAQAKLQVILETSAAHPRSAAPFFSPLAQEILRQGIRSYKFWLDEPMRAKDNAGLNKAKNDTSVGTADEEMEYWSENHYIMFASSEYLAGQLWATDNFQPAREFLAPDDKSGILTGKNRKERGRARILKWLNNRLQFGWMEFNSSGYYREHLWALLNLVDFALDREVRDKAIMAVDLLLFDAVRFLHKGTMGAAGGRSQFKSKNCGWDNALGDVLEIMLGTRGIFSEADGQIASSFATSQYAVPDVLLQIGCFPPTAGFTDRSRVSITFEEAPKYGITYSMKSDQKDSVLQGYAAKRSQYFTFLDSVNNEIARTHTGYGATEDATVFWWGMSAFLNKQVVRNTFAAVDKFGLDKTGVFKGAPPLLIKTLLPLIKEGTNGLIGGLLTSTFVGGIPGAVVGFFADDILGSDLEQNSSDDLSLFLEGSTRTRANLLTYRNGDVMLSSIQNFRSGQLNYQSSVNQATLNSSVNVFTTSGFAGLDISDLAAGILGGLGGAALAFAAGAVGFGVGAAAATAVVGAVAGVAANEGLVKDTNPFGGSVHDGDEDGPGWWTGYLALPMIVQHESAAIIAYDFHPIQKFMAKTSSHVWFPKSGFDRAEEMRTSAYDDANFFLLDITDIGPKGFWLFGKIIHPADARDPGSPREAYVGVFSNQRPKWLDQDSDLYSRRLKEQDEKPIKDTQDSIDKKLDGLGDKSNIGYTGQQVIQIVVQRSVNSNYAPQIERDAWLKKVKDELGSSTAALVVNNMDALVELAGLYMDLSNMQRIWKKPIPMDYFADRDWYVEGKNIWILQVGNKEEFGDFEHFKDRVSSARVHLDDSGDMECSYDIPKADGSSERLSLAYGDGGSFQLNGNPFPTDMYPRFENPFIRGGVMEWGQREYVIEHNGKSLLHDVSDFAQPIRQQDIKSSQDDRNTIKGLVIFLRTGDAAMDAFTVATATVGIGCSQVTKDQVVAAGPASELTNHDAEWIFFDFPTMRNPDMTLSLSHPASSNGDDTPHWQMSFSLKALLGDRTVRDCSLSFSYFNFEDKNRKSGPFPFSVSLSEWRPWKPIDNHKNPAFWMIAAQPSFEKYYYDYVDLLVLDQDGQLWNRRLKSCLDAETGWFKVGRSGGDGPDFSKPFSAVAISAQPGQLFLFVQSEGSLFAAWPSPAGEWSSGWVKLDVHIYPDGIFGIPDTTAPPIAVTLNSSSRVIGKTSSVSTDGAELIVSASDGNFYSHPDWHLYDQEAWRKIDVNGFSVLEEVDFSGAGDFLLALDNRRQLWAAAIDHSNRHISPHWEKISAPGFSVSRFTVACIDGGCQILVAGQAEIWAAGYQVGSAPAWVLLNQPNTFIVSPEAALTWAAPYPGHLDFFTIGTDGKVYTIGWDSGSGWSSNLSWVSIGEDTDGFEAHPGGGISSFSRVSRQVEVFAQSKDQELFKSWWS
jgi:hypothetical protein